MESIWSQSCPIPERPPLSGGIQTEVAVIGAGMAGILIADRLQRAGKQVVVLEAGRIAGGQTRNTTAKITSQHGLFYRRLIQDTGEENARRYAMANEAAIREYRERVRSESIDCDWQEENAYLYGGSASLLEEEAEAARQLGLPARYLPGFPLPFFPGGVVEFSGQAQFHPLKFIRAVAESLIIYEHTTVQTVEEHSIQTNRGQVEAEQIVFACHFPFLNFPGMYFARMHQERSYVLALAQADFPKGMFLGAGEPSYSIRHYGDILLFGGEGHRTGENARGGRYQALRQKAQEIFPGSREVGCWSAQDCMPIDRIPYIGAYSPGKPDWYVATGFQKWGMTSAMVSAMLLSDLICGNGNPYAPAFSPERISTQGIPNLMNEGGQAVKGLAKQIFQLPADTIDSLAPGFGGIVTHQGQKTGVYKDEGGQAYLVDTRCPHLGCQLEWNPDEKSWDCPCHGSRFDYRGKRISGPAQEDIGYEA